MAKSIDIRKSYGTTYDPVYCKLNGWLSPALKAVQHDFDGMKLKAEEFCSSQDPSDSGVVQKIGDVGLCRNKILEGFWFKI